MFLFSHFQEGDHLDINLGRCCGYLNSSNGNNGHVANTFSWRLCPGWGICCST